MKPKSNPFFRHLLAATSLGFASAASAGVLYWDANGTTAGAGTTPTGNWLTNSYWSASSAGTATPGSWSDGSDAVFSAGTDATGASTLTISAGSNVSAASLTFEEGTVSIGGSTNNNLTLTGTGNITVSSGATAQIGNGTTLNLAGTGGITKLGLGTLTLNAYDDMAFSGGVNVNAGKLFVNFSSNIAANMIRTTNVLSLGGGTLEVKQKANAASSQTFASTTINAGDSGVIATVNGTGGVYINLQSITRNAGGIVTFTNPAGTLSTTNSIKTSTGSASTILTDSGVAYATVGGSDWAAKDSTNAWIVGLSSLSGYTNSTTTALSGNADVASGVNTTLSADSSIASLRFNQAEARAITLGTGTTLTTGGILVTSAVGNNLSSITGGTLRSAATASGKDLVIINNAPSNSLTIGSAIADAAAGATGLTKSGAGTVTLAGANTYTGANAINAGMLQFAKATSLYNGATGSWTAANIKVANAATLALNVGGTNEFTTGNVTTLLTNLGGANGSITTGFASGSTIGFDTTNASGGNFSVTNIITDSIGTGGGALSLIKLGTNTLTLSGASTFTGGTTITAGTVIAKTSSTALGAATGSLRLNGGTMDIQYNSTTSISAYNTTVGGDVTIISDKATSSAGVTHTLGTLSIGANTLTVTKGSLVASGTAGLTFGSTTLTSGPSVFDAGTGTALTLGTVSGSGFGLTKQGAGSMTVGSYTAGTLTVNGGTFTSTVSSDGFNPSTKSIVINNGGTFNGLNNGIENSVIITINSGGTFNMNGNTDVVGSITGAGTLTNTGTSQALQFDLPSSQTFDGQITGAVRLYLVGRLTGAGTARSLTLTNASNNFTGNININAAAASITGDVSLILGNSGVITDTSLVTVNGSATASGTGSYIGILDMNGKNETIGGLAGGAPTSPGTRSGSVTNKGSLDSMLTVNIASGSQDFSGVISDGATNKLSLVKAGAGTQTLSGSNTYTGNTAVTAGTLNVAAGASLAAGSAVTVSNSGSALVVNGTVNGTLLTHVNTTLSGSGTVAGNTTIQGVHNPGNSPGIQTFSGDLTYSGGSSVVNWELTANTSTQGDPIRVFDQIMVGGNLDFTDLTTLNLSFAGAGSNVLWSDAFWTTDQSWVLYDVTGIDKTTSNIANLSLTLIDWTDSGTNALSSVRNGASFQVSIVGNDVRLNYIIPEPEAAMLGGLGLLALLRRRRN